MPKNKRSVILILLTSFIWWACKSTQEVNKTGQLIKNVHFSTNDNNVWIFYDLQGNAESSYQIQLLASTNGGKTYTISPTNVTGDVGKGVHPGKNKQIIWNVMEDYPDGIKGLNFQFLVKAHQDKPFLNHQIVKYALIGVASVGIGVTLYLLLHSNNKSGHSGGFPLPPPRPTN